MTQALIQRRTSCTVAATTVATVLVAGALSVAATTSAAQSQARAVTRVADLEKVFWACDYAATVGQIDLGSAITCSEFTEALKVRKFNGDFQAMMAWWRANKSAEHLALDAGTRPAVQDKSVAQR